MNLFELFWLNFFGHPPAEEPTGPTQSIAQIASENGNFDILVAALDAAGLTQTFADPGDFTVFAPTDAAFTELASNTLGLDVEGKSETEIALALVDALGVHTLTDVLLFHVKSGASTVAEIQAAGSVHTLLAGADFHVNGNELIDADPEVEDPEFVDGLTDIAASNGIIQVIDRVLLPIDVAEANAQPTIADIANSNDAFEALAAALAATGLDAAVGVRGTDLTVFAPTDDAFRALAQDLGLDVDGVADADLAGLLVDALGVPIVANVLLYHVSVGASTVAELQSTGTIHTALTGATIHVNGDELVDADPDLENPNFVNGLTDIEAANGVVQVIDRVLLPVDVDPVVTEPNIVDIAAGSDDFNILVAALSAAGLVDAVRDFDDITVFAPTDAAFGQLAVDLGFGGDTADEPAVVAFLLDALAGLAEDGNPVPVLANILLYHVSPGAKTAAEVDALSWVLTLLAGETFGSEGTELIDNEPDIDNPSIVGPDISASNGVIQVIDRVLLPIDIPGNEPLPTIAEIAGGNDAFEVLVAALTATGLVDVFTNPDADFTVFAPTDDAFRALAGDLGLDVSGLSDAELAGALVDALGADLVTDVLLYHVKAGGSTVAELQDDRLVEPLLAGSRFGVDGEELVDADPQVSNPNFVEGLTDIAASNGVVQVIDRVLLPLDVADTPHVTEFGTKGDDYLQGGASGDFLAGDGGDDIISAGKGRDAVYGNSGDDLIFADGGADSALGGLGNDKIFGGKGRDTLLGGGHDDVLRGGQQSDKLFGGKGDDKLAGQGGSDSLTGGQGHDLFIFGRLFGDDVVNDFRGSDQLSVSADVFADFVAVESAASMDGDDLLIVGGNGSIRLVGVDSIDEGDVIFT